MANSDLSTVLPRVLIVSRRTVHNNKFVDFVVPVIVPRVTGVHMLLQSFEPIHGVLLCEGKDIDPSHYEVQISGFSPEELEEIGKLHANDTAVDKERDSIELGLKLCLERNIPYLGICRGSQVLNVACGGTLYQDVEKELSKECLEDQKVAHIDYNNYDRHQHRVKVVENTPLHQWFRDSLDEEKMEMLVNSYHHQGVKRLAQRFVPMAFALDGLIEGFYDPDAYNPDQGKFTMGLQFHPEKLRQPNSDNFECPGCPSTYQEFVKAVRAYEKELSQTLSSVPRAPKLNHEQEVKRKSIVRSFSIAKDLYSRRGVVSGKESDDQLNAGAEFLETNTALSLQEEKRLQQMGATVRNASAYMERLKHSEERERVARAIIGKMSIEQLSDLMSFYQIMSKMCSHALEAKFADLLREVDS